MAADDMPDFEIQGGSWIHKGHAQTLELQGLPFPRSKTRGRGSFESQRCESVSMGSVAVNIDWKQNLKSAEEMEEEERAAQSAKLQELIRRGRPEDLQEANRLMKIMAGYDTRNKTDYRAKAAEEVSRVQQKAKLLEERLQAFQAGDKMTEGDVFEVGSPDSGLNEC